MIGDSKVGAVNNGSEVGGRVGVRDEKGTGEARDWTKRG
jgi:hypothetical protein